MDDEADSPTHPGAILREALCERGLSQRDFAATVGVPVRYLARFINGRVGITSEAALRLAHYFRSSPLLWLESQMTYDLHYARLRSADLIRRTVPHDDARLAASCPPTDASLEEDVLPAPSALSADANGHLD
ncbi:MAG TPA: HigA family addiction module antitoxin [Candidatus Angelobacter sp.]|nr:HigA family addiction module antitoxin [Candidatus Angelobacter sp.]